MNRRRKERGKSVSRPTAAQRIGFRQQRVTWIRSHRWMRRIQEVCTSRLYHLFHPQTLAICVSVSVSSFCRRKEFYPLFSPISYICAHSTDSISSHSFSPPPPASTTACCRCFRSTHSFSRETIKAVLGTRFDRIADRLLRTEWGGRKGSVLSRGETLYSCQMITAASHHKSQCNEIKPIFCNVNEKLILRNEMLHSSLQFKLVSSENVPNQQTDWLCVCESVVQTSLGMQSGTGTTANCLFNRMLWQATRLTGKQGGSRYAWKESQMM